MAEIASWYWEPHVTRGKSRDCGYSRRPFRVRATPRSSVSGLNVAGLARSVLLASAKVGMCLTFSCLTLHQHEQSWQTSRGFVCRKMSRSKFVGLSAQLFKAPLLAMSSEEVRLCATYWARRLLPWLAKAIGFNPAERLSFGDWRDAAASDPLLHSEARECRCL